MFSVLFKFNLRGDIVSDRKERQHFVPVMYYRNFYSQIDDIENNAKKGLIACYRMPEQNLFHDKGKNIGCKRLLYEYSKDEEKVNEIENRFYQNIEVPSGPLLRKIISETNKHDNVVATLSKEDLHQLHAFMIVQMFRHPLIIPDMINLIKTIVEQQNKNTIPDEYKKEYDDMIKGEFLKSISDTNTEFIRNGTRDFYEKYYTVILHSNGFNFFTSEVPIILTFSSEPTGNTIFFDLDIHMPINKDLCIALFPKHTTPKIQNWQIVEVDKNFYEDLLLASLSVSNIVVSNSFSAETIEIINTLYPKAKREKDEFVKKYLTKK